MTTLTSYNTEVINQWHEGLGQISRAWVEWLPDNAEKHPTYAAAWREFKSQLYQELGLSLQEMTILNTLLFD